MFLKNVAFTKFILSLGLNQPVSHSQLRMWLFLFLKEEKFV